MITKSRATDTDKLINNRVRLLRIARRITQNEMAKELNVSTQQIAKYERGTNRIPASRLLTIANMFKVDITCFFRSEECPETDLNGNKIEKGNILLELGLHQVCFDFMKLTPAHQKGISQLIRILAAN